MPQKNHSSLPRKRQTRLPFAPEQKKETSPATPAASDKATAQTAPPPNSSSVESTPGRRCTHFEVVILTPSKTSASSNTLHVASATPSTGKRTSSPIEINSSGDDDIDSPVRPPSGKRLKSHQPLLSDSDEVALQELNSRAASSSRPRGVANSNATKRKTQPAEDSSDDDDEDDDILSPGKRRRKNSLSAAIFSDQIEQDHTTPRPSSVRRLKPKLAISDDSEQSEDDEDDEALVRSGRRKSSQKPKAPQRNLLFGRGIGADLDSDSDLEILPPHVQQDKEDGDEGDLDDDIKLALKTPIVETRTRYSGSAPKLTPFQHKLAALKAKREGRSFPTDSDAESTHRRALYDTDTETTGTIKDEEESFGPEDGSEDDSDDAVTKFYAEDQDTYDPNFVVEDDPEALLGVPDVPLHLTAAAHQSPSTSFKIYSHWLLLALLCPDLSTSEPELVTLSRKNLERRVETYGTSVLTSSVWTLPFSRAFRARPEFCQTLTSIDHTHCDACNRPRQAGTWVWFSGPRYDPDTLEELDESDLDSQDSVGVDIPDEDTRFALGRHCLTRAEMAHAFHHWKYQLKEVLKGELVNRRYIQEDTGELAGKWMRKTVEMRDSKREAWAMRVAKRLDGDLQSLHEQFANSLVDAEKHMKAQSSGKWRFHGLVKRFIR